MDRLRSERRWRLGQTPYRGWDVERKLVGRQALAAGVVSVAEYRGVWARQPDKLFRDMES